MEKENETENKQEQAAETKEIVAKEKPQKPVKIKKAPKLVSQKKLPKMFRKKYTPKTYAKLLKKIYIDSDKQLVVSVLEKQQDKKGREIYVVDQTKEIVKKDAGRLKLVAKQIKKQKATIKLIPLLAIVIVVAGIGITVTTFKNVIVKKAIVSAMQGIFQAKTDIQSVDVQIFGASIEIKGLEQASQESPMKNIFQIDDIALGFELTDLLKGKFHVEKVGVQGVAIGTDRKTSGEIPVKSKKAKARKQKQNAIIDEKNEILNIAKGKMIDLFDQYNPEKIAANLIDELKSPILAQAIYDDVLKKIDKWQAVPAVYEKSITEFMSSVQTIIETDWSKMRDIKKIQEAIETVGIAVNQGQEIVNAVTVTFEDVKADTMIALDYAHEIQETVLTDKDLIESTVNNMLNLFTIDGLTEIMTDAVSSIVYDYTAKYGPYVTQIVDYAMTTAETAVSASINKTPEQKQADKAAKAQKEAEKDAKKAKKDAVQKSRERAKGRDIYYKQDRVPKLLIEQMIASGYEFKSDDLLFKGVATNVTSNQNMINSATSIEADFKVLGNPNDASIIIDARTNTDLPLVAANYNGHGYDISADAAIFAFESKSDITAMLAADRDGSFNVGGFIDMDIANMTGMDFEPDILCKVYKNALAGITELSVGFGINYSADKKLSIELKNLDKLVQQLVNPIEKAIMDELLLMVETAKAEAIKLLSEKTGIATETILKFTDISSAMTEIQKQADELKILLEQKQTEIVDSLVAYAKQHANEALKDLVPDELQKYLPVDIDTLTDMVTNPNALKDAATDAAKQAEETARAAADEAKRQAEEAARAAADEAKRQAEEAADEAKRKAEEAAEEAKRKAEEEAKKAAEEAKKKAEEELKKKAEEEAKNAASGALKGLFGR